MPSIRPIKILAPKGSAARAAAPKAGEAPADKTDVAARARTRLPASSVALEPKPKSPPPFFFFLRLFPTFEILSPGIGEFDIIVAIF